METCLTGAVARVLSSPQGLTSDATPASSGSAAHHYVDARSDNAFKDPRLSILDHQRCFLGLSYRLDLLAEVSIGTMDTSATVPHWGDVL